MGSLLAAPRAGTGAGEHRRRRMEGMAAAGGGGPWPQQVRAATRAHLDSLQAHPALTAP